MSTYVAASVRWYSATRDLLCDGTTVGALFFRAPKGAIVLDGQQYPVYKRGVWTRIITLEQYVSFPLEARLRGMFNITADFTYKGVQYALLWPALSSIPTLSFPGADPIPIRSRGVFKRTTQAEFPPSVPPIICAFVLWAVIDKQREDASS